MAWMSYKLWSGAVTGKRIRVPTTVSSVAGLGLSHSAIALLPGAVGRIRNILGEDSAVPRYVKFAGYFQDLTYAAEVLIERRENPQPVWNALQNLLMHPDQTTVVIRRRELDRMEIEYQ